MQAFRAFLVRVLPRRTVDRIRRRRALKRFLEAASHELVGRETRLDDLEERLASRRGSFYERVVKEVLERLDLVLEELDRRIEGQEARHARDLRELEAQIASLRDRLETLRDQAPVD